MRIVVLGSKGMAGHIVSKFLQENTSWEILGWGREDFEITACDFWKNKLKVTNQDKKIDFIINCIGIIKPIANANPILAMKVNALFPHQLVELANELETGVIHLSTDCWEDLDAYGRSKRAGEFDLPSHLTLRTSIIGPELKQNGFGLFHWFMTQKNEVNGFVNHYWDGVTTLDLAKVLKKLVEDKNQISGLKELRTKDKINKFELINSLNVIFSKGLKINKKETEIVDKTNDSPNILYSVPIPQQIKNLKEWMDIHPQLYSQYK